MLDLEPERTLPAQFPYEDKGWLSVPDIDKIIKKDKIWHDTKFVANQESIFDKRITARLKIGDLPQKF
jgi:hypothetical protein